MPSVSVVIPAYRNVRFVERTVDSALAQTHADLEVVIADHSSDDGSWEALQRYAEEPRVRLIRTPAGGGAKANWDAATEAASGEYLKLLPGDDLIAPDCVERQAAALGAHPSAVMAAARRDVIDPHDEVLLSGRGLGPIQGLVDGRRAIRLAVRSGTNLFGEPGCVLIRREALIELGGWLDPFPYLLDQFTYMSLLRHGDVVGLPETLASFRLSHSQWSARLVAHQGRQAVQAHRRIRAEMPEVVSRWDVAIGNAQATRMALMRRAAYAVWRRRLG